MTKKVQTKNKSKGVVKCTNNVPFGLISSSILSTQSLARVKLEREKKSNAHYDQSITSSLSKKLI